MCYLYGPLYIRKQLAKVYSPNAAVRFVPRPLARYICTIYYYLG